MGAAMTDVEMRALNPDDVESLVDIEQANQPKPWTRGVFLDELAADNRIYRAIVDGESIYGFGGILVTGDEAHVTNLLVAPDQRRQGFGRRLLISLISEALERGARHLTLEVRSRNESALALYRQFGLGPVGVRKGYYGDDDALILWAYDIDTPEYSHRLKALI